jgi:hypothetical protein
VDPDNVDGYTNNTGFPLSYQDQIAFNSWLASEAHQRGLSIGLKNDLDQIDDLIDYVDLSVNEQCHEYAECNLLQPFIEAGKPVFNAEYLASYRTNPAPLCADSLAADIRTLILSIDLDDSYNFSCDTDSP